MREGKIPADWFSAQVAQADRTDGDIDTLSNRIAHVRTWTFVANRPDWLADPEHWQAVARGVEDKLSDALHERLTERFVDRRTSVLMRRLRENTTLETEIKKTGEVVVEGHDIGRLDGFTFVADASAAGSEAKALAGRRAERRSPARSTRAPPSSRRRPTASSCWPSDGIDALDRRAGRQADRRRRRAAAAACASSPTSISPARRARRCRRGSISGSRPTSRRLLAPLFALAGGRRHHRHRARRRLPVDRGARRAGAAEGRRGRQGPRPAVARAACANTACASAPITSTCRRCSSPRRAALAAQLWALKHGGPDDQGPRRVAAARVERPHLDPGRQGHAEAALPHHRLSGLRRARGARRHPGAARRSDPAGAGLARRLAGAKPAGAFSGFGFTVTGAMTSLTGASGEDFASILRSLGYRMEKRPKPPEPEPAAAVGRRPKPRRSRRCRRRPKPQPKPPTDDAGEPTAEHAPTLAPDAEPPNARRSSAVASEPPAEAAAAGRQSGGAADAAAAERLRRAAAPVER